jgi:hypothetical protein
MLKAQIGDLEALLKKHKKDWQAYQGVLLDRACPNHKHHTPQPSGQREWMAWSIEMSKTHRSVTCPGCKRNEMWVPIQRRR